LQVIEAAAKGAANNEPGDLWREGVTMAPGVLRRRKPINYSRGEITILDRLGLQAAACSCYAAARKTYTSIMK
jgi:hypothetical protein